MREETCQFIWKIIGLRRDWTWKIYWTSGAVESAACRDLEDSSSDSLESEEEDEEDEEDEEPSFLDIVALSVTHVPSLP